MFDLDLGVNVTQNVAQYPLHHVTYLGTKFEVATTIGLGGDAFTNIHYLTFDIDLVVNVTRNDAQYPLYHVTYTGTT